MERGEVFQMIETKLCAEGLDEAWLMLHATGMDTDRRMGGIFNIPQEEDEDSQVPGKLRL